MTVQFTGASDDARATEVMVRRHPWMRDLTPKDQVRCTRDLVDAENLVDAETGSLATDAVITMTAWRETARAVAEGLDRPVDWFADGDEKLVERP